jgi:LuxR family transcriptional regulator, regulator of acetate metabolism
VALAQDNAAERRMQTMLRIRESMARLRPLATRAQVIGQAPREVCASCGFSRALLSRIQGSLWIPEVLHAHDPPEDFLEFIRTAEIPLKHMLLETEMVRRRRAELVSDARSDARVYRGIIESSRAHSYTATPILIGRRAIGFMHCDRLGQDDPVTNQDRDNVWAFALELGLIIERAALRERLGTFQNETRRRLEHTLRDIAALNDAPLVIGEEPPSVTSIEHGDQSPTTRLLLALSPREREVLDLLTTGSTNASLADELIVSEATVKSHVKSILRKLRVDNRAEAVARYLQAVRTI